MNKIIVFAGAYGTGKTRLADEIKDGLLFNRSFVLSGRHKYLFEDPFLFEMAKPDTKLIIIDDLYRFGTEGIPGLYKFAKGVNINRRYQKSFKIKAPILVTSNYGELFKGEKNCEVIEFPIDYLKAADLRDGIIKEISNI